MAKAIGGVPLDSSASWKPKKSSKLWWVTLWSIVLLGCMVAGFHYGGIELLKLQADQRAVESVPLPIHDPSVTAYWMQDIGKGRTKVYSASVTLQKGYPGLECLYTTLGPICNWEKYNAEQARGDD